MFEKHLVGYWETTDVKRVFLISIYPVQYLLIKLMTNFLLLEFDCAQNENNLTAWPVVWVVKKNRLAKIMTLCHGGRYFRANCDQSVE